ncbi:MAG: acyl carrier protein [Phycisphaerales bacterium]|nr:acyl carrier protein [Phycisphaerales bacterium]
MTATEEKLIELLLANLRPVRRSPAPVTEQTAIFGRDGLGLDSVDVLEVAVLLDKHFGVVLEPEDPAVRPALTNISALAAYIDAHNGASPSEPKTP